MKTIRTMTKNVSSQQSTRLWDRFLFVTTVVLRPWKWPRKVLVTLQNSSLIWQCVTNLISLWNQNNYYFVLTANLHNYNNKKQYPIHKASQRWAPSPFHFALTEDEYGCAWSRKSSSWRRHTSRLKRLKRLTRKVMSTMFPLSRRFLTFPRC